MSHRITTIHTRRNIDMSTKAGATIDDLYTVEGKAELVNGKIAELPPAGDDPEFANLKMAS
jgi:hypothetical protein